MTEQPQVDAAADRCPADNGGSAAAEAIPADNGGSAAAEAIPADNGGSAARPVRREGFRTLAFGVSAFVVVADQASKALVRTTVPLHSSRQIIPGLLDLTHVQNTGAAFGFLNAVDFPFKPVVIALVATAALFSIAMYAASISPHQRIARFGLALILGGAVGNLIDRIAAGYVVDFVDVYWREHHFWAFNVADSAITVGVVGMMLDTLGIGSRRRE